MYPPSRASRVCAMRGGIGISIMVGVPEHTVVVCPLVPQGVIDVDVYHVTRELGHHLPPAGITGSQELVREAGDGVVLIVVMRDERLRSGMADPFVVAINFAEMAPTVF